MNRIDYLDVGGDVLLAYRKRAGRGPTLLFLPGYLSDMEGTKAQTLDRWAEQNDRAMVRFDYAGCGASGGSAQDQGLADWHANVLAVIDRVADGPVVLVGSSMGGWLMLHAALARPDRIAALVGIAAAPDFTSWGFTDDQKLQILREGRIEEPNPYGDQPTVTTRRFWESGEGMRLLHTDVEVDRPVRLLHGQQDADVPWTWSVEIARRIRSADVQTLLVKDGDHRLSRERDLVLLIDTVGALMEAL